MDREHRSGKPSRYFAIAPYRISYSWAKVAIDTGTDYVALVVRVSATRKSFQLKMKTITPVEIKTRFYQGNDHLGKDLAIIAAVYPRGLQKSFGISLMKVAISHNPSGRLIVVCPRITASRVLKIPIIRHDKLGTDKGNRWKHIEYQHP